MKNHYLIGKRLRIDEMVNEPHPIEAGTMGTITNVGYDIINVNWDNGRTLGVVIGEDKYEVFD